MSQPTRNPLSWAGEWGPSLDYEPGDVVTVNYFPPIAFATGNPLFLCTAHAQAGGGGPGNPTTALFHGQPMTPIRPNGKWTQIGMLGKGSAGPAVPWRGDWRSDLGYETGDMVNSEGSAYYASSLIAAGQSRPGRWVRDDPWKVVVKTRFPLFHGSWNAATVYNAWDIVQHGLKWWSPVDPDNPLIGVEPGRDNTSWQILLELPDQSKWRPAEIATLTTSIFAAAVATTSLGLTAGKFGLELRKLQTELGAGLTANVRNALNQALSNEEAQELPQLAKLQRIAGQAQSAADKAVAARNEMTTAFVEALTKLKQ